MTPSLLFIGGGNMATAIIGGLVRSGTAPASIGVVEPVAAQRETLQRTLGVIVWDSVAEAGDVLGGVTRVVWAVKPQSFTEAAAPAAGRLAGALHLSVMAGIRSDALVRATGSERVVRAMPNTPALIGMGISGLYARPAVDGSDRAGVEALLAPTGTVLWVDQESDLDAVTALSGSGPAYVFFFVEAMMAAAQRMGLSEAQGKTLALATFAGATELARRSDEPPSVLRERVTSKGGTTHAALTAMGEAGMAPAFIAALEAAQRRARELGDAFGA